MILSSPSTAQMSRFINFFNKSDSIDPSMKLLLTLMVNQTSTIAILVQKLGDSEAAYGQPPSYADWESAFTENRHYRSVVESGLPESDLSLPSQRQSNINNCNFGLLILLPTKIKSKKYRTTVKSNACQSKSFKLGARSKAKVVS